jgi:hypothetical protein
LSDAVLLALSGSKNGGTIPTEIGDLTHLTGLHFEITSVMGTIPSEIGLLTNLSILTGSATSLQGKLPSEIGQLRFLGKFSFRESCGCELSDATRKINTDLIIFMFQRICN